MWKTLATSLRYKHEIVFTVASSGIASLLLPRGRIAPSKFKLPVSILDNSTCNIEYNDVYGKLLRETKLIIWDEAPMASKFCFEVLDKTLKNGMSSYRNSKQIFGGKEPNDGYADINIPRDILIENFDDSIVAIVESAYPTFMDDYKSFNYLKSRAILGSTIEVVDQIINHIIDMISRQSKDYYSSNLVDHIEIYDNRIIEVLTPEFLSSLRTSGFPNVIKLNVGTPIMLMRNIDQSEGLCNETRLIVTNMENHVLEIEIMGGKGHGKLIYIPRMDMSPSQSPWPFKLNRRQFPIIVSFAMTINKS
ncbi:uncharacterized protein LOC131649213 [Vicia villosa]|uniref:uncharacterized protein LOC131649213 n=1 Tax=Vicia villosa TaxID=3911 RepID=UPI00273B3D47|nr:uncharacterized protein LOC131649213 [Vicia villosa]